MMVIEKAVGSGAELLRLSATTIRGPRDTLIPQPFIRGLKNLKF